VAEEPQTVVTVEALVSDRNAPQLTVPEAKVVREGASFPEGRTGDVSPSYYQGVYATDAEDGDIDYRAIRHDSPVNTAVKGAYVVNYEVTDSDHNTVRKAGMVFVGDWIIADGFAVSAESFEKRLGTMKGTEAEAVSEAKAVAYDLREYVNGEPNPGYHKQTRVKVADDGGYYSKKAGSFNITFAAEDSQSIGVTIAAKVSTGAAPVIDVPLYRTVPVGGGFSYMVGVSASVEEDGDLTANVVYNTPVNTAEPSAYRVMYQVTDSDGNTTTKYGAVLVGGGWVVKEGYALYANDFARKLSAIAGTPQEAGRLAKARAVWIANTASPDFCKYVPVKIVSLGGYKKAAGNYRITFAVSEKTTVRKRIKASISDDSPVAPVVNTTTVQPTTTVTQVPRVTPTVTPVATSPAVADPMVVPAPDTPEDVTIGDTDVPQAAPIPVEDEGAWHLADLILAVLTMLLGLYLLFVVVRRKHDDGDERQEKLARRVRTWGVVGAVTGIGAVVALLLTQQFAGDMGIIDIWTILFGALMATEAIAYSGVHSAKEDEWFEEREV
jgi:hypothetical protein